MESRSLDTTPGEELSQMLPRAFLQRIADRGVVMGIRYDGNGTRYMELEKSGRVLRLHGGNETNPPSFWSKIENTPSWESIPKQERPKGIVTELYKSVLELLQELTYFYNKPVHYTIITSNRAMLMWLKLHIQLFPRYEGYIGTDRATLKMVFHKKGLLERKLYGRYL